MLVSMLLTLAGIVIVLAVAAACAWLLYFKPFFNAQVKLSQSKIGTAGNKKKGTAIVIGGSIGGLLSSRVLSFHYENIIILEQGQYQNDLSIAPQGQQTHAFLNRSIDIIKRIFEGDLGYDIDKEWVEMGAFKVNIVNSDYAPIDGESDKIGTLLCGKGISDSYSMTRSMIETWIRNEVLGKFDQEDTSEKKKNLGKIQVKENAKVTSLIFKNEQVGNVNKHRVMGVRLENGEEIYADLVVDCSGINTQTPKWVEKEFSKTSSFTMKKSKVSVPITYATAIYNIKEDCLLNNTGFYKKEGTDLPCWIYIGSVGIPSRLGMIFYRINKTQAMIILGETGKKSQCSNIKNHEDCLAYLRERAPACARKTEIIFENIELEAARDWMVYKKDGTVYNHWEEVNQWKDGEGIQHQLENFIAVGDSVGSLNPVYGQGIAAIGETLLILDEFLRRDNSHQWTGDVCQDFQHRTYCIYMPAYFMATLGDLMLEETKGSSWWYRKLVVPFFKKTLERTAKAAKIDPYVRKNFHHITHMYEDFLYKMFDKEYQRRTKDPINHW